MSMPNQPTTVVQPHGLFRILRDNESLLQLAGQMHVRSHSLKRFTALEVFKGMSLLGRFSCTDAVRALSGNPTMISALVHNTYRRLAERQTTFADVDYVADLKQGHLYFVATALTTVVDGMRSWYSGTSNNNVLRRLIADNPIGGRELPPDLPEPTDDELLSTLLTEEPDALPVIRHSEERNRLIDAYGEQRWAANAELAERVALGVSGVVHVSDVQTLRTGDFIVRSFIASTDGETHVFDGRVLWMHVFNVRTNEMFFMALGGGDNTQHMYNAINSVAGGYLFGGMNKAHGVWQRVVGSPAAVTGLHDPAVWERVKNGYDENPNSYLRDIWLARVVDGVGYVGARYRHLSGNAVTKGAPTGPPVTFDEPGDE